MSPQGNEMRTVENRGLAAHSETSHEGDRLYASCPPDGRFDPEGFLCLEERKGFPARTPADVFASFSIKQRFYASLLNSYPLTPLTLSSVISTFNTDKSSA